MRPRLAVSLGDPAGIGPEVVLAALARPEVVARADAVVVGDAGLIAAAAERLGLPAPGAVHAPPEVACAPARLFEGRASAEGGRAAAAAVRAAVALVTGGQADALVTAPLNKEALGLAGEPYPGHTELLAAELKAPRVRMLLQGGALRVVLVTIHEALRDVPRLVTREAVVETCEVAAEGLARLGVARPRLALAALNPHAGDGGRFGREELEVLAPAVEEARARGLDVTGPHPADTLFARAARPGAGVDAVVACYHDQGLIPVKLAAFGKATNITLGLPILRTSPDHGTAYDIAGRGVAEADSFAEALLVAADLVARGARRL
ncbi:MAG: 4-hydroxythreonine-4-phosphate dehydrogenase PdxA [Planctomycetes bacterium]|nr:4-hydroxythreonine-4-phosphate dehydrogenase PdxA [Planctomycetota bacterium]